MESHSKDFQAIMTVLGRRGQQYDRRPLDLSQTDLRGIDLEDAHFERALLGKAHLEGVNLCQAHLEGEFLESALGLHQADIDNAVGDHTTKLPSGLQDPDHWAECTDLMRCRSPLEVVPFVYRPQREAAIESRRQPSAAVQSRGSTREFQLPPWDIDNLRSWRKNGTGSIHCGPLEPF